MTKTNVFHIAANTYILVLNSIIISYFITLLIEKFKISICYLLLILKD